MNSAIHFDNVSLTLGNNSILKMVDFCVGRGKIHFIIGPNGGGKTSLLRCLLGQMPHTGTIRLNSQACEVTGYVPQSLQFDHTLPMTVTDFMAMSCQNRPVFMGANKGHERTIDSVLRRVGMLSRKDRPFGGLSGGERQRVLLAQALIPKPTLLILDEPATGLDKAGSEVMHEIMKELREDGVTILLVHHDLGIVKEIGDEVTCINKNLLFSGQPCEELTPERIFSIYSGSGGTSDSTCHSISTRQNDTATNQPQALKADKTQAA